MLFNILFYFILFIILVYWIGLFLIPKSVLVRKYFSSDSFWITLGIIYFMILFYSWRVNWISLIIPSISNVQMAFNNEYLGPIVWINIMLGNLFMGRWIAFDSFRRNTILFPFMFSTFLLGPVGLSLYLLFNKNKKIKRA